MDNILVAAQEILALYARTLGDNSGAGVWTATFPARLTGVIIPVELLDQLQKATIHGLRTGHIEGA